MNTTAHRFQTAEVVPAIRFNARHGRCSLCGHDLSNGRVVASDEERLEEHVSRVHIDPQVGDFVQYRMVTDTQVFEVIGRTAKTLKLRMTNDGEIVRREDQDGSGWPQVWTAAVTDETLPVVTSRLGSKGTFKVYGYGVLSYAAMIDGTPARFTDYRM